jgi:transposase
MSEKKTYSREFKLEAVRLSETSGKSIVEVERDLGLSPNLLRKWRRDLSQKRGDAFVGKGNLTEAEAEVRRLHRELEVTRQERDLLKKAVAFFAKEQR